MILKNKNEFEANIKKVKVSNYKVVELRNKNMVMYIAKTKIEIINIQKQMRK